MPSTENDGPGKIIPVLASFILTDAITGDSSEAVIILLLKCSDKFELPTSSLRMSSTIFSWFIRWLGLKLVCIHHHINWQN